MKQRCVFLLAPVFLTGILAVVLAIVPTLALASGGSFIGPFHTVSVLASPSPAAVTRIPMVRLLFQPRLETWFRAIFW